MKLLIKHIILIFIYSSLFTVTFSQKSYIKKISNVQSESFALTQNTSDGGWITATSSKTLHPNPQKAGLLLIKYSKCSQIQWSKFYYFDAEYFTFSDFLIENNGNMMITGYNCFYDACNTVVIYLSSNGNLIWCKSLNSSLSKYVYSIGKTTDNNYFIFGIITDINAAMPRNYIIKFNSAANIIWSYKYFDNPVWGEAVAVESNNILVRSGNLIYKLNGSGQINWAKRFIGLHYSSKPVINNNSYIYANFPSSSNDSICHLINLSTSGLLSFTGTGFRGKNLGRLHKLNNGNVLITGGYKDNAGNSSLNLIETLPNGGIVNQKIIPNNSGASIDKGCDLVRLADNSVIITARNNQSGELYTLKTNQNQEVLCGESIINDVFTAPDLNVTIENTNPSLLPTGFTNSIIKILNVNLNETSFCYIPDTLNLNLGNDTTLCGGEKLILKSNLSGNFSYLWSTGETTSQITVSNTGIYWLKLIGCDTISDTIKVNFSKALNINYTIKPRIVDLGESITFSNFTSGFQSYFWETGDGNTYTANNFKHNYEHTGFFYPVIHFRDSSNCEYSDTSKVEIHFLSVYIPNSFTPNGDGLNEVFDIKGEGIKSYTLYIYNRWGQLIYTAQNHGWNGSCLRNEVQTGTYHYKAEITDLFGKLYQRNGSVVLIK